MRIYFPIIQGKSGSDVFTRNLANGLNELDITTDVKVFSPLSGFFPPLLRSKEKPTEYDIVHANSWNGFLFKHDFPLIVTEHTAIHDPTITRYKTQRKKFFHQYIKTTEKKTLDVSDTIICVSSYCKKIIESQFGVTCDKVIYNGVDPVFFKKQNEDLRDNKKMTLFFSGNHTRMKGFDLILSIANRLKDVAEIVISSGFKQNRIEKLSSNITSVGTLSRKEMLFYYNNCDIYLFPTRLEGCSLTVAEAMACEMPIIATNCASLPEQVDDGKGGFLCRMDDVDDFVRNILYISEDEELRYRMGRYNREKVLDMFTDSQMTDNYVSEYQKMNR